MATTQLTMPLINGLRHGFSSAEINVAGIIIVGIKSINYSRKRTRTMVRGNHPDPIAQTRGENEYSADIEVYLAEYNLLQQTLMGLASGTNGAGYGDVPFTIRVTYGENGFDTITDEIIGCNLDSAEAALAQGPDALTRKVDLQPLKVRFAQTDDLAVPLVGQTQ